MRYATSAFPLVLAALILLIANEIAQPPDTLRPKVFIIGLSKTGTTSIGDALALLGYKRLGWKDIRSRHLVHSYANDDYGALFDQTRYYDAFEDLPWPFVYRQMAERYPDSKFVLSLRKDDQTWLRSMQRHVGRGTWLPYEYFYGAHQVDGHEDKVLRAYQNHTENVRAYFANQQERYVELVIDDGDVNWESLCRFTGQPLPNVGFPKSNTAAHWQNGTMQDTLHFMWSWSITRVEEQSAFWYYRGGQSTVAFILKLAWSVVSIIEQACSELYYKATAVPPESLISVGYPREPIRLPELSAAEVEMTAS